MDRTNFEMLEYGINTFPRTWDGHFPLTVKFYLISMRLLVEFLRTIWCSNWFVTSCRRLCPVTPFRGIYSTWWTWPSNHCMKLTKTFNFAFSLGDIAISGPRWAQMLLDDCRWPKPIPDCPRWAQMMPDGPEWSQTTWFQMMMSDGPRWSQMIPGWS